jgi:hypothetical protein
MATASNQCGRLLLKGWFSGTRHVRRNACRRGRIVVADDWMILAIRRGSTCGQAASLYLMPQWLR